MPTYQYIAKTHTGDEVTGAMQADNESAVARTLDERRLFPVQIAAQDETSASGGGSGRRIRLRDVSVFYSQLSDLLAAGVPVLRSLKTLAKAVPNRRFAQIVIEVHDSISSGETLAESMSHHGEAFTPLHTAMVRAGEEAGFLEDVLANLGAFLDGQDEVRNKVRGALIYPIVLTVMGVSVISAMLVWAVPKFKNFISAAHTPLPTKVLFAASDVLINYWPAVVGVIAGTVFAVILGLKSPAGRELWSRWQLRLPVVGATLRSVGISRFCRILGTMLHNGVPILNALDISKDATGNVVLAKSVENAGESVKGGDRLADPLDASGLFPAEIIEMIAVAEESNQLEKVLVKIADTVDRRTARQVETAVKLIEPLILIIIAGAIAMIAVGLLYPMFTMINALQ
jgi:general secretion pathway protein F/type IV pilus assembly protein PilC